MELIKVICNFFITNIIPFSVTRKLNQLCCSCFFLKSILYDLKRTEAVVQRCSVRKVFLKISQNSQENTCVRVSFFRVSFFYRTPLVAAFSAAPENGAL